MTRREFITLLGGSAAVSVWPLAAGAQQLGMPVIGFLNGASPEGYVPYLAAFHQGFKEAGYVEGANVTIEYRWARGRYDLLPSLVAELVALRPVVIVACGGDPAALAAKAATSTIPVVFLIGGDPVQQGLVASFNRPGGNVTGTTMLTLTLDAKRLGLLRDLLPRLDTVALLANPNFPDAEGRQHRVEEAARMIGLELKILHAGSESEIDKVLSELDRQHASALVIGGDPFFNSRREQIVALVARKAIPAIYEWREFTVAGGLMSYGTSATDTYRSVGIYAGRALKGEKPSDLPVMQPTKFELVINVNTAKALGLTLPSGLISIADDVIE